MNVHHFVSSWTISVLKMIYYTPVNRQNDWRCIVQEAKHKLITYAPSCWRKGFAISSHPSTGLSRVIVGPLRTTNPSDRVRDPVSKTDMSKWYHWDDGRNTHQIGVSLRPRRVRDWEVDRIPSRPPLLYTMGQYTIGSFKYRCIPSRPPVNLTRIRWLAYFERSKIASRLGLSIVGWGPLPPRVAEAPLPPRAPPRP